MRILYIDIDTLRSDHLGCFGYHRNTSPNLDRIAAQGVRFNRCYASDAPCLPSRTALITGQFGIHNGVVDHGGVAADLFIEGPGRGFRSRLGETSWARALGRAGYHTVTISPFAERHSAWWWYANFAEAHNPRKYGDEVAHDVSPLAIDWLKRNAHRDQWFLHVNFWDPHVTYRTPQEFGEPFRDAPLPAWLTDEVRRQHWELAGPESARESAEFHMVCRRQKPHYFEAYPRQPLQMDSMDQVRRMFDGYDTGIRYADHHVGYLLNELADQGVLDDTAIFVGTDHGENLGELNMYMSHMTCDEATTHVPWIIRWPGVTHAQAGRADQALHYSVDVAATITELAGGTVPDNWDGRSFAPALRAGRDAGRDALILSHLAGACQRSVRFDDSLLIRSYHDGYHCLPDTMLFDVAADPHMTENLAPDRPHDVGRAMALLDQWYGEMMRTATHAQDPLWTVMLAGGPEHTRGYLPMYLQRLRETGRTRWADYLEARHPREAKA